MLRQGAVRPAANLIDARREPLSGTAALSRDERAGVLLSTRQKLEIMETDGHGFGVFLKPREVLSPTDVLAVFGGEVKWADHINLVASKWADKMCNLPHNCKETGKVADREEVHKVYYQFRKSYEWGLTEGKVVDPFELVMSFRMGDKRNLTHLGGLFNHASQPNCKIMDVSFGGVLVPTVGIKGGELRNNSDSPLELTLSYGQRHGSQHILQATPPWVRFDVSVEVVLDQKQHKFAFGSESVELSKIDLLCPDAHPDMVEYNSMILSSSYPDVKDPAITIHNEPGLLQAAAGVEQLLLKHPSHTDEHVDWQSQTPDNGNQLKLARTERRGKGFGNYDLTATGILDDSEQRNHTLLVDGGAFERTWINRAEAIGEADDSIGAAFLVGILR